MEITQCNFKNQAHNYLLDNLLTTVVSEKKGTFICEIVMEHYIYLRNTQKQLKITNYVRNRSFLEF